MFTVSSVIMFCISMSKSPQSVEESESSLGPLDESMMSDAVLLQQVLVLGCVGRTVLGRVFGLVGLCLLLAAQPLMLKVDGRLSGVCGRPQSRDASSTFASTTSSEPDV